MTGLVQNTPSLYTERLSLNEHSAVVKWLATPSAAFGHGFGRVFPSLGVFAFPINVRELLAGCLTSESNLTAGPRVCLEVGTDSCVPEDRVSAKVIAIPILLHVEPAADEQHGHSFPSGRTGLETL